MPIDQADLFIASPREGHISFYPVPHSLRAFHNSATAIGAESHHRYTSVRGPDPVEKGHQSPHRPDPEAIDPHDRRDHAQSNPGHHDTEHTDRSDGCSQRKPATHAEGAAEPQLVESDGAGRS